MASSQKIILNADGSVKLTILGNYIQKGNNGVDEIYIGVVALPSSVSGVANFELPNGDVNTIAGVYQAQISDGQGSSYKGFKFTLTQAQTLYVGDVKMSLQLTDANSNVLYSYSSVLTINPAVMTPSEQQITQAQWNSLVSSLAGYQLQYAQPNVRGYNSLADAQADINNLATNQIILYKDNTEWQIGVYNGTSIVSITTISDKYLPLSGGILTKGGFHIGTDQWGNELISSPIDGKILVNDITGENLIKLNQDGKLEIHQVADPVLDLDVSNKKYADKIYNDSQNYTDANVEPLSAQISGLSGNLEVLATYIPGDTSTSNKLVNETELNSKIVNVYKYKGSVATYNDLPTTNLTNGDVYNVLDTGKNYAYVSSTNSWDDLGGSVDVSNYYTKNETDDKITSNIGKLLQLDFTGTLVGTNVVFEPTTPINASDLNDNTTYELDFHFTGVGLLSSYTMTIKLTDNTIIDISSILGSGSVGAFKQLEKFDVDTGYRWIFNAVYNTLNGVHSFGIPSTIVKPEIISVSDEDLLNAIGTNDYVEGQLLFVSKVGNDNGYNLGFTYKVIYAMGVIDNYENLTATPKSTTLAISGTTTTYTFTFNLGANDIIQISPISGDESKFANAGVSTSISGNVLTITCVNYVETFSINLSYTKGEAL